MSGWPRVIEDVHRDTVRVDHVVHLVTIISNAGGRQTLIALTVDQCAALIAAITDAARVVTGEGK